MPSVRIDADVRERLAEIKRYLKRAGLNGATYSDAVRWLLSVSEEEIKRLRAGDYRVVKEIKGV
jgi:mRNA-degrading endonuclease RelE of RelBE toxin-antitoxin system